ncbi:MAG TPA: hypothetical protein ENK91_05635, partial [Bacteroidetes bacterium]|nr:hypothetical protein [Bacteroidota bacterium]
VAFIEGPFITLAGGIAAALGYYDILIILGLAIIGDVGGDALYYAIGSYNNKILKSKFFRLIGINDTKISKIETLVHGHIRKAVLLVKLSPVLGPVGQIVIGTTRADFTKFFTTSFVLGTIKTSFFALLGFYSVKTYINIDKTIANTQYSILGILIFSTLIYFLYKRFKTLILKKI